MNKRIYLIGFMASGKTLIGKTLAKSLGLKFVDTDRWIESKTGLKIAQIFTLHGEAYFRQLETEAITQLANENNIVISTGGGLPCFNNNLPRLKMSGTVIFLKCGFETSFQRLQGSKTRPLSTILSKPQLKKLYYDRLNFYAQADFTVLSNRELSTVVKRMITLMNKKK